MARILFSSMKYARRIASCSSTLIISSPPLSMGCSPYDSREWLGGFIFNCQSSAGWAQFILAKTIGTPLSWKAHPIIQLVVTKLITMMMWVLPYLTHLTTIQSRIIMFRTMAAAFCYMYRVTIMHLQTIVSQTTTVPLDCRVPHRTIQSAITQYQTTVGALAYRTRRTTSYISIISLIPVLGSSTFNRGRVPTGF